MSSNFPLDSSGLGRAEKATLNFRDDQSFLKTSEQINRFQGRPKTKQPSKAKKKTIRDISDVMGNIRSLVPLPNYSAIQSLDSGSWLAIFCNIT